MLDGDVPSVSNWLLENRYIAFFFLLGFNWRCFVIFQLVDSVHWNWVEMLSNFYHGFWESSVMCTHVPCRQESIGQMGNAVS